MKFGVNLLEMRGDDCDVAAKSEATALRRKTRGNIERPFEERSDEFTDITFSTLT